MKKAIIILLLLLTGCTTGEVVREVKENIVNEEPDIDVFFCPQDNCEKELLNLLDSANHSIHCAFYDLNLNNITELLESKNKVIDVKLVIDDHNYKKIKNATFARKDTTSQLMHHKFCIIDNRIVSTGSFNPTERGSYFNNNNFLIITSEYLSKNYESEFDELWDGVFGKGEKTDFPIIISTKTTIKNYFCPEDKCSEKVIKAIRSANKSIYFMTFSFTHPKIANELVLRHYNGIEIKGIFEKRQMSKYSKFNLLEFQGLDVKSDSNKYNMHHKVFIIDNETIITGSFNPTKNGDNRNDENILIIHDSRIARLYMNEFSELWALP